MRTIQNFEESSGGLGGNAGGLEKCKDIWALQLVARFPSCPTQYGDDKHRGVWCNQEEEARWRAAAAGEEAE